MRVLVVDDCALDAEALIRTIGHGCPKAMVSHVETANEALELIQYESFDCALVDVRLPDADGRDLARDLECLGISTQVMSGGAADGLSDRVLAKVGPHFVTRALQFVVLIATLSKVARG